MSSRGSSDADYYTKSNGEAKMGGGWAGAGYNIILPIHATNHIDPVKQLHICKEIEH